MRYVGGTTRYVNEHARTRVITNFLLESMDDGLLAPRDLAEMALQYMSEDEVADMARSNDLLVDLEEYDEGL